MNYDQNSSQAPLFHGPLNQSRLFTSNIELASKAKPNCILTILHIRPGPWFTSKSAPVFVGMVLSEYDIQLPEPVKCDLYVTFFRCSKYFVYDICKWDCFRQDFLIKKGVQNI